ncbi:Asp-tRNA(Asn)/Glu-tRNA(Gln) amidotransferase subunit GatC [Lacticaseibacillus hulanensis]|uniref:Asp-tRNA(Asn)/Glu-tRNA(Gln) amidotransferase subunit GatC n=1 Tax=Lacticaseibacillus hulanensis TaxID=2493111 RepID=UPI000FDC8F21|nr:Asp-tRNA(Asn)/Glu-tRNA(Gln) amidotransferase subunit GatC [Lacticaseibacillus hulanensis]
MISKDDVAHVAQLARLQFTDEELQEFTGQLDEILNMVDQLSEVDTTYVPVTTQNVMLENVMREDKATFVTPRADLMKNAPTEKDGLIQVPAIIDKEED